MFYNDIKMVNVAELVFIQYIRLYTREPTGIKYPEELAYSVHYVHR